MSSWNKCLVKLEADLTSEQIGMWIMPLHVDSKNGDLHLYAPNRFVLDWVKEHYLEKIKSIYKEVTNNKNAVISLTIGSLKSENKENKVKKSSDIDNYRHSGNKDLRLVDKTSAGNINPNFTFDSFIQGKSNQIAKAASYQVGGNPGKAYNPLFIYGGVGLGKTHLMHAVGNYILGVKPEDKVVYLHSERFVSEMVKALQHNKMDEFKKYYRNVNALLIDDVQFFAGKERTQEEFFHTFNALFESQQQIVLSSDRFPKEVSGLEERLRSRFGWGLTVAIEPPDLETRVAILQSKAELIGVILPEEVAFFVGNKIKSNIRELEGALRRLVANSHFTGQKISIEFAKDALRDMVAAQEKLVTIDNIQKVVAEYYKIRTSELISRKRTRSIARPRQLAMSLAKQLTNHSLPEIGEAFGGRDHTTVLHANRKIKELIVSEPKIAEDFNNLFRLLST